MVNKDKNLTRDMGKFLIQLCRNSDESWSSRSDRVEKFYQTAIKLIERAGMKYKPKKSQWWRDGDNQLRFRRSSQRMPVGKHKHRC